MNMSNKTYFSHLDKCLQEQYVILGKKVAVSWLIFVRERQKYSEFAIKGVEFLNTIRQKSW